MITEHVSSPTTNLAFIQKVLGLCPSDTLLDTLTFQINSGIVLTYLLTYLLHGTGYSLKSWQSLSLSNNSLIFLWKPKVHYCAHKSPPPDPILSQPNPVRSIDTYLPRVHLNVIFPPAPRSSQWSLTFGPPNQNPVNTPPPTSSSLI
jgi:hypothetical protein